MQRTEIHLLDFGTRLRIAGGIFKITVPDKTGGGADREMEIAPHQVETILMHEHASISTNAIVAAIQHDIDVLICDGFGHPLGRFMPLKPTAPVRIQKAQLIVSNLPIALDYARQWLIEKNNHQIQLLHHIALYRQQAFKDWTRTIIMRLQPILKEYGRVDMADVKKAAAQLRGIEGTFSRLYFEALSKMMPDGYAFDTRSRQPAQDIFNAVLNYGYGILYRRIDKALTQAGLNPYIGFMHRDDYKRPSLVFDFIEPLRVISDMVALKLCRQKQIGQKHLDETKTNGCHLNKEGKKIVAVAFNEIWLQKMDMFNKAELNWQQYLAQKTRLLTNQLLSHLPLHDSDNSEIPFAS
jgi:CRISPR-associated protein Cas1